MMQWMRFEPRPFWVMMSVAVADDYTTRRDFVQPPLFKPLCPTGRAIAAVMMCLRRSSQARWDRAPARFASPRLPRRMLSHSHFVA
jgi:hypothetical protein